MLFLCSSGGDTFSGALLITAIRVLHQVEAVANPLGYSRTKQGPQLDNEEGPAGNADLIQTGLFTTG